MRGRVLLGMVLRCSCDIAISAGFLILRSGGCALEIDNVALVFLWLGMWFENGYR